MVLWVYFFIYSYRHKVIFPWGFSIVIVGILVSGIGYHYYNNKVVVFSINFPLAVSLIGILCNINNVQNQFYVRNLREFLRLIGIGLISGLLLGFVLGITAQGAKYFQIPSQYTVAALIAIGVQGSLAEELLFRGYFLGYLRRYEFNTIFAILLQALIFAFLHIPLYVDNWKALFVIFLTGVTTGYFTWKNNNLVSAIVLHIVANLVALLLWMLSAKIPLTIPT